jgi:hypothetical protein
MNGSEAALTLGRLLPPSPIGRLFSERRFDVVHVHNPFGVALPIIAAG